MTAIWILLAIAAALAVWCAATVLRDIHVQRKDRS